MRTRKPIWVWAVLPLLAVGGTVGRGQAPAPPGVRKVYTNRTAFKLPLQVDERERSRLQEIQLWVKTGPAAPWTKRDAVPPTQKEFIFRTQEDGEYWFTLVTLDRSGKANPADVTQEPPGLVVVVDRQPPEVEVRPLAMGPGQACLQCEIRDPNPDPARSKLEYLTADQNWLALEAIPDQPGLFRVPDANILHGLVRATVADRAGNTTTREINLQAGATAQVVPAAAPAPPASSPFAPAAPPPVTQAGAPGKVTENPVVPASAIEVKAEKITGAASQTPGAAKQYINTTHASLKYQIEQVGPSGIGKVEVWMTRDEGQTWQRLCEDPNRRSPVEVDLPGEGSYGVSVLATNGNGVGGEPPGRGDVPDFRLEVDMTKPVGQILAVKPGTAEEIGTFQITWTANDKNLKADPIDLYYAARPEGPWTVIAKGLKNDGSYRWPCPRDGSTEAYVRMDVTDLAGNTATCQAAQPVVFDRSRPKAHIVGVIPGSGGSAAAVH